MKQSKIYLKNVIHIELMQDILLELTSCNELLFSSNIRTIKALHHNKQVTIAYAINKVSYHQNTLITFSIQHTAHNELLIKLKGDTIKNKYFFLLLDQDKKMKDITIYNNENLIHKMQVIKTTIKQILKGNKTIA